MVFDHAIARLSGQARLALALVVAGALLSLPTACGGKASGSGCIVFGDGITIEFEADETDGFDDTSSPGAALGVAFDDEDEDVAMIVALRFTAATFERTYEPTCDVESSIESYDFGELNSITTGVAAAYPFLANGLTDTNGIEGMDHTMNALLFINDGDGVRVFLATDGELTMTRTLGGSAEIRVRGNLTFVELTQASAAGGILAGGESVRVDDIDFTWETTVQPM